VRSRMAASTWTNGNRIAHEQLRLTHIRPDRARTYRHRQIQVQPVAHRRLLDYQQARRAEAHVFIHRLGPLVEVANNRITQHGRFTGGVNLGNGEVPARYVNDGTTPQARHRSACPRATGILPKAAIPLTVQPRVRITTNDHLQTTRAWRTRVLGHRPRRRGASRSAVVGQRSARHNGSPATSAPADMLGGGVAHGAERQRRDIDHIRAVQPEHTPRCRPNGGGIGIIGANGRVAAQWPMSVARPAMSIAAAIGDGMATC